LLPEEPPAKNHRGITHGTGLSSTLLSSQVTTTHRTKFLSEPVSGQPLKLTRSASPAQDLSLGRSEDLRGTARMVPALTLTPEGVSVVGWPCRPADDRLAIHPPGSCRLLYFTRSVSLAQLRFPGLACIARCCR
jgi:hypothetical protein